MTPEGKVKAAIRATLRRYEPDVWTYMPVPGGYGRTALDYIGACCGMAFSIEAKRKGARPTPRQEMVIDQMERADMRVFVIDGPDGLGELDQWLTTVVNAKSSPR